MPVHDWTRVSDGTVHDFHYSWVLEIKRALKRGLLPEGYYVMAEQFGGDLGAPDVLKLQRGVVIRHTSDNYIVAVIEILAPAINTCQHAPRMFLNKSAEYVLGCERPLTVAAYTGGTVVGVFVDHFAVGEPIPEMPLFLTRENYVRVPLEATYMAAWEDVPPQYQAALQGEQAE